MATNTLQDVFDAARGYLHDVGPAKNIVSISNATPPVVNIPSHGYSEGAAVAIVGDSVGAYNSLWQLHVVDLDNFSLVGGTAAGAGTGGTASAGGEVWTNAQLQLHFNQPYRTMFTCMVGASKRVQRTVQIIFPEYTTVLVPSAFGLADLSEPEIIEERQATTPITITSTAATTPIRVTASGHGLSNNAEVDISGVVGTPSPWGNWFVTVIDADTFSLNGSVTDGKTGMGGTAMLSGTTSWSDVGAIDQDKQGLDGQPGSYLGKYLWQNGQLRFRGATQAQELRITYWASGNPPANAATTIGIDDCIDFLACATAANAARASGWFQLADQLRAQAYGADQEANAYGGLLENLINNQVMTLQRGPQRRMRPFREKISRYGTYLWG